MTRTAWGLSTAAFVVALVAPASAQPAGWTEVTPMPLRPSGRAAGNGAWLAVHDSAGRRYIYATKGNETGDFARYDVGLGLGGPIRKNRLWYYIAYNPAVDKEDVEIPGCGFHEDQTTTHSFATKLTWQPGPRRGPRRSPRRR